MKRTLFFAMLTLLPPNQASARIVAGWIEQAVFVSPKNSAETLFEVKLDTGATTSSFNTGGKFEEFKRAGKPWVRFSIRNHENQLFEIESLIVRYATVKRTGVPAEKRPVIILKSCLGGFEIDSEFTLTDRSDMDYPVLIGRNFMQSDVLVDSGRTKVTSTQGCFK